MEFFSDHLVSASFTHKDVQDMHTEDAIDDADLAAPSPPPLTRSREQSLQVPLPATPSVPPVTFATVLPQPPPPVSIFGQTFSSMTESALSTAFLNNNVVFERFLFFHLSTVRLLFHLLRPI